MVKRKSTQRELELKDTEAVLKKAKKLKRYDSVARLGLRKEELEKGISREQAVRKFRGGVSRAVDRALSSRLKYRRLLKPTKQPTIVIGTGKQPEYESIFFKEEKISKNPFFKSFLFGD